MIRQTATIFVEILVTFFQSSDQVGKGDNTHSGNRSQLIDIGVKKCRVFNHHGFVGAPGWQYSNFETIGLNLLMILQVIYRVVGRTYRMNIGHPDDIPATVSRRF